MQKRDAEESTEIATRAMTELLGSVKIYGRQGAEVRYAIGDFLIRLPDLFASDEAGEPMAKCFRLARLAGVSLMRFDNIRKTVLSETPETPGGGLTQAVLAQFCLSQEARVIADMEFRSRQDADAVRNQMNEAFAISENLAADVKDSATYMALVKLHAAVMYHLAETARPLPRLIKFRFGKPLPTLVVSYRLYDDASRSDDLIAENKVVHPAFMRNEGLALSF